MTISTPRGYMYRCVLSALVCCQGLPVYAQSDIPDPSAEIQRQDLQRQALRKLSEEQPWAPSGLLASTPSHQQLPDEQPCVLVDHIEIQSILFSEKLQSALRGINGDDPPNGRCLGSKSITLLIQRAQQALVEQGYITSHVHAVEQDLTSGKLVLQVNEGRLANIRAQPVDFSMPRMAWAVREGDILNLRDIEQTSDNLQRLPSFDSKIQIEPGQAPGTSDLVVDFHSTRPLRLVLNVYDTGSRTNGKLQGNATLSWDSPLGMADLFYFTQGQDLGNKDAGPRGSRNQIVHYSVPWGYWLVGATFSDNRYKQTVYGPYDAYLYSGTSSQKEVSLSRVLRRDGRSKTTASIKGYVRQSNNFIADLEVLVQRRRTSGWEAGLQHLQFFESGTLMTQLAYRHGTGAFGAQLAPEEFTGQGT